MTGKQHMMLGTFIGVTGSIVIGNPIASFPFAFGAVIGSLTPDIDSPTSKISKIIPILPKIINKMFGHRGLIHAPIFYILVALFLSPWAKESVPYSYFCYGFLTGCVAHLIQDLFTKGGLPLFYPFYRKKFAIGFLKSGSKADFFTTLLLMGAWCFILFKTYPYIV